MQFEEKEKLVADHLSKMEKYKGQGMVKAFMRNMNWIDSILQHLLPGLWIKRVCRKMGISKSPLELHQALSEFEHVYVIPSKSGIRGFRLVLDDEIALYFFQNDDHFEYDGWEVGKYNKGKSTLNIQEVL